MWANSWSVGPAPRRRWPRIDLAQLGRRSRASLTTVATSSASRVHSLVSFAAGRWHARRNSGKPLFWDRVDAAGIVFCVLVVIAMAVALWFLVLPVANGQHVTY